MAGLFACCGEAGWACDRAPIASEGPGEAGAGRAAGWAGAVACAAAAAGARPSAAATARNLKRVFI
jgi:hypothetical protein